MGIAGTLYSAGKGMVAAVNWFRSESGGSGTDIHYDPFLTLYELALIPLMSTSDQSMLKLNFGQFSIDRVEYDMNTRVWRTLGSWTGVNPQSRLSTDVMVQVAIRAIRQYEATDNSERAQKIAFLFSKAIIGLGKLSETYEKSMRSKHTSRTAVDNYSKAQRILRNAREGKEQSEEVQAAMKQQEGAVEMTTRNHWIIGKGSTTEVDLITTRLEHLKQVYELKENDAQKVAFQRECQSLEDILASDKKNYVASLSTRT